MRSDEGKNPKKVGGLSETSQPFRSLIL